MSMRSFIIELARLGGEIAKRHFNPQGMANYNEKGRNDFVSHVDQQVEAAIISRIHAAYPDHAIIAEEQAEHTRSNTQGPCWIIDPIDGTTNFIRGIPHWSISLCFCDRNAIPQHGCVYDVMGGEQFIAERGAGTWVNKQRVYTSKKKELPGALIAGALPFKHTPALSDVIQVIEAQQLICGDFRRAGSAALDLAYVATGRLDAYWELGLQPWDIAAGMLLVESAGGAASDLRGASGNPLGMRSICAAASTELQQILLTRCESLLPWLDNPAFAPLKLCNESED